MILLLLIIVTLWVIWRIYHFLAYPNHSLEGKTILITGACTELGRQLCVELVAQKARVIAWDSSKLRLEDLKKEMTARAGQYTNAPTTTSMRSASSNASSSAMGSGTDFNDKFVAMYVDLTSRLQIQRALNELEQFLPPISKYGSSSSSSTTTAASSSAQSVSAVGSSSSVGSTKSRVTGTNSNTYNGGGVRGSQFVDIVINAAHLFPLKPCVEREEDSAEKIYGTNVLSALLLARHFIPKMLERKEGGQFVTLAHSGMASLYGGISSASPDYAASQWAAVGQHHSLAAWARQERKQYKTRGEVRFSLLYMKEVELGLPGFTTSAARPAGARAGSPTGTLRQSIGEGKDDSPNAKLKNNNSNNNKEEEGSMLQMAARDAVYAIGRREECYGRTVTDVFTPMLWALPLPWSGRLLQLLGYGGNEQATADRDNAKNK